MFFPDPVTKGLSITVNWLGMQEDVSSYSACSNNIHSVLESPVLHQELVYSFYFLLQEAIFWSQHVSFILVGVIVITSVRGLLITLTKVLMLTISTLVTI